MSETEFNVARIDVKRPADFLDFKRQGIFQGIHERIEEQVLRYPGHAALDTAEVTYSYAKMNRAANSVAEKILSVAGRGLAQAAILLPNTPDMVIAMLGAMKAHKAHVPLDPGFPKDRLGIMLEDAEAAVVITDDEHLPLAHELTRSRVPIITTSAIDFDAETPNPGVPCDPMERAYILYTSGSTGRPKGIEFLHRNLLHGTMAFVNNLAYSHSDRVTWLHSASFAASVVDIYCPLTTGGTIYPWDVKTQGFTGLADWLRSKRITTFQWIPSAFRQFLRTVPDHLIFEDIRVVVMASEPLTVREVELFRKHFPKESRLVNQLGTSEAHNYRLFPIDHHIKIEGANVPGGYEVSDERRVLILDDNHKPLSDGKVGEIGVQSEFMCAGYWRDEALTRSKFLQNDSGAGPIYLTGDLGRLEPDGCLMHLGRKDFQVKIRGYRVELAEVEHAVAGAPGIADAAAGVIKNRLDQDQLVAYVVLQEGACLNKAAVESYLETRLPAYMVPRHFTVLDRLPTLPTGKTDRKSLPNPFTEVAPRMSESAEDEMPRSEQIAILVAESLRMKEVSADLNFDEAGGDSILTAVLLQRIYDRFDVRISPREFGLSPTPRHLAELVRKALEGGKTTPEKSPDIITPSRTLRADDNALQQNLLIISAGSLGREVFNWASEAIHAGARYKIKGFLDNRPHLLEGYGYQTTIFNPDTYEIQEGDVFIGAIGDPIEKIRYYSPIIEKGGRFINVVHPRANIGKNVRLGTGVVIDPYTALTTDVTVGDHVAIGTFTNIGHDVVIGSWCQISSHCGVNGHGKLGEAVFLGSHACVLPGLNVGNGAFVGAGSVVTRNVAARTKVFGNPAAVIGEV